jgi:hypothetical protein
MAAALPVKTTFIELREPTWSPSGKTIAYVRWREQPPRSPYPNATTTGQIWIADANGSHRHPVTSLMAIPRSLSWAPDGQAIVFTTGAGETKHAGLWTVDVRTRTLTNLAHYAGNTSWSPDGTRIAYLTLGTHGGEVDVIPASGGTPTYVAFYGGTPGGSGAPLVWSPDSRYVEVFPYLYPSDGSGGSTETDAIGWSRNGALKLTRDHSVVNIATGRILGTVPSMIRPQLAPDGAAVAGTTLSGKVRIASVKTGRVTDAPGAQSANDTVSWSPQHQLAYVGSGPCGPRSQIDIFQTTGNASRVLARSC